MDSLTDYGILLVTTDSQQKAEKIANVLVEEKLAAGANFSSIDSIYTWQGKIKNTKNGNFL